MYNKKLPNKIVRNVLGKTKRSDFRNEKVMFKIITVPMELWVEGKKTKVGGGEIFEVIDFVEGKYYVTNKPYKQGVPQLIPWAAGMRIREVKK